MFDAIPPPRIFGPEVNAQVDVVFLLEFPI